MPDSLCRGLRLVERLVSLEWLRLGKARVHLRLGPGETRVHRGRWREICPVKLLGGRFVGGWLRGVEPGRFVSEWRGSGRHNRRHHVKLLGGRFVRRWLNIKVLGLVFRGQGKPLRFFANRRRFRRRFPVYRQGKTLGRLVIRIINRQNGRGRCGRCGPVVTGLGPELAHDTGPARGKPADRPFQRLLQVLPDPADYNWIFQYLCFFVVPVVRAVKSIMLCQKFALYWPHPARPVTCEERAAGGV